MSSEVKHLVVNLACPPGQFALKTSWDKQKILYAISHADEDGYHELQGVDDSNDTVIVRWRENSTLFYIITEYKKQGQITVPRLVATGDKRVQ